MDVVLDEVRKVGTCSGYEDDRGHTDVRLSRGLLGCTRRLKPRNVCVAFAWILSRLPFALQMSSRRQSNLKLCSRMKRQMWPRTRRWRECQMASKDESEMSAMLMFCGVRRKSEKG